MLAATELQQM